MTAWHFNPELTFEKVGDDWLVLYPDAAVVLRASGPAAEVLTATATASPAPAHLVDAAAVLAERGVLVEDAAPGMSRRRLISTGALAAGAATLAAAAGIHTLVLPTAASAASTLAAPTGVAATAVFFDQVDVSWDLVSGATSYQVYFKAASGSAFTTFGGPVSNGPVPVTGLDTSTTYNFYVTATDGTLTSADSEVKNATTTAVPVPTEVVATAISFDQVSVSWTLVSGASNYRVGYRKTVDGGPYNDFGTHSGPVPVTGLEASTAYEFIVSAIFGDRESFPSLIASATTDPPP